MKEVILEKIIKMRINVLKKRIELYPQDLDDIEVYQDRITEYEMILSLYHDPETFYYILEV